MLSSPNHFIGFFFLCMLFCVTSLSVSGVKTCFVRLESGICSCLMEQWGTCTDHVGRWEALVLEHGHATSPRARCADQWQGHTFPTASVYESSPRAGWQGAEDFLAKIVVVDVTWSSALEFDVEVPGCLPGGCGDARSDASVLKARAEHRWGKQLVPFSHLYNRIPRSTLYPFVLRCPWSHARRADPRSGLRAAAVVRRSCNSSSCKDSPGIDKL